MTSFDCNTIMWQTLIQINGNYLLVISNFLEQKVILLLQKVSCYIIFCIIYSTLGNYISENV